MQNLIEGLIDELSRNEKLAQVYDTIPQGVFGATMIRADIKRARQAIADGDTVGMLSVYKSLKENE